MMRDYVILGIRNLRKRKLRSWLTMLGIFISIATIFVLVSMSVGLQQAVTEEFRAFGTDKFFIQPGGQVAGPGSGGAASLTSRDIETIERISGVKDISYMTFGNAEVEFRSEKRFLLVVGYPLDKDDVLVESASYKATSGELLREGDRGKVMLGSRFGDISVFTNPLAVGNSLKINGVSFKVNALLEPIGNPVDDKLVYLSLDDFKDLYNNTDRIDQIIVQVSPGVDVKEVAERTEKRLISTRGVTEDTKDFSILTPEELLESFGSILDIITIFLIAVAGISLIVGGVGIMNTMYTSVLERTKEIGVMKAVGARNQDILSIFLIESGLLGLMGGLIGVLLGWGISETISVIANTILGTDLLQAAAPWYLFAGCLAFAFVTGAVSGMLPAWQASKVRPVKALRYE